MNPPPCGGLQLGIAQQSTNPTYTHTRGGALTPPIVAKVRKYSEVKNDSPDTSQCCIIQHPHQRMDGFSAPPTVRSEKCDYFCPGERFLDLWVIAQTTSGSSISRHPGEIWLNVRTQRKFLPNPFRQQ